MKPCSKDIYRAFLNEFKPDVIHVHTLQGFHKELFEAAKECSIRMVYTTHDTIRFVLYAFYWITTMSNAMEIVRKSVLSVIRDGDWQKSRNF